MKKYARMLIALAAIYVLSFTQTFERSVVLAVGGLDKCNGSDIAELPCAQFAGSQAQCASDAKYRKVEDVQDYKDEISVEKTECTQNGCENISKNPSPRNDPKCEKHTTITRILDPVEEVLEL